MKLRICTLIILFSSSIFAQEDSILKDTIELDEVLVKATRVEEDAPFTQSYVTKQEIDARNEQADRNLQESHCQLELAKEKNEQLVVSKAIGECASQHNSFSINWTEMVNLRGKKYPVNAYSIQAIMQND